MGKEKRTCQYCGKTYKRKNWLDAGIDYTPYCSKKCAEKDK